MPSNELTISDIAASGLGQSSPDEDVSKHNPYVEFEIGSQKYKTKSNKKAGTEVSWDKDTVPFSSKAGDILTVAVWHKRHLLSDVVIGKGQVTVAQLGGNGPVEVKLTEPKAGSPAGVLRFTVSGHPEAPSSAAPLQPRPASSSTGGTGAKPADPTSAGTAGFVGTGAEAHDESGVKTGRAYPKDGDTTAASGPATSGSEAAAVGAGAAAAAGAGAAATGAAAAHGSDKPAGSAVSGLDTSQPTDTATPATGAPKQTYTEAAKEKAISAADFTAEKLQDLKVGLVGEEGAAKAEGKAPAATSETQAQGTYIDSAKAGAAFVITKTQDALAFTKDKVLGSGSPAASPANPEVPAVSDVKADVPSNADKATF